MSKKKLQFKVHHIEICLFSMLTLMSDSRHGTTHIMMTDDHEQVHDLFTVIRSRLRTDYQRLCIKAFLEIKHTTCVEIVSHVISCSKSTLWFNVNSSGSTLSLKILFSHRVPVCVLCKIHDNMSCDCRNLDIIFLIVQVFFTCAILSSWHMSALKLFVPVHACKKICNTG